MIQFTDLNIPEELKLTLKNLGFEKPTDIQSESIPQAIEGRDVIASSKTGSGKTLAFSIPLITRIQSLEGNAIILTPTREIAIQVSKVIFQLTKGLNTYYALLIGGEPMFKQIAQLKKKPQIIIGTPGRVMDHIERGNLNLTKTEIIVLDEADRMLDMGFDVQIEEIFSHLNADSQKLMFSATFPPRIEKLCHKYMKNAVRIATQSNEEPYFEVKKVKQQFHHKKCFNTKFDHLHDRIKENQDIAYVIFAKTKSTVDELKDRLKEQGVVADGIHGDLSQHIRRRVIENFRNKKYNVLIATDIIARGLDVPHIQVVINFDMPTNFEDYIHRIGRTNRQSGLEGEILNLFNNNDIRLMKQITQELGHKIDLPQGGEGRGGSRGGGRFGERKSFGDRHERGSFGGERRSFGNRDDSRGGGRFGERKSFGNRDGGSRRWTKKED